MEMIEVTVCAGTWEYPMRQWKVVLSPREIRSVVPDGDHCRIEMSPIRGDDYGGQTIYNAKETYRAVMSRIRGRG